MKECNAWRARSIVAVAGGAVLLAASLWLLDRYDIPSLLLYRMGSTAKYVRLRLSPIVITDEDIFQSISLPAMPEAGLDGLRAKDARVAWKEYIRFRANESSKAAFVDAETRRHIGPMLLERFPGEYAKVIASADAYAVDSFEVYGRVLKLGSDFSWTRYPVPTNDVIFVWEYNSLQHLVLLAEARILRGDGKYFEAILRHLRSWRAANPVDNSVNWIDPMEVSIRLCTLVWLSEILIDDDRVEELYPDLMKLMVAHARFVADRMDAPRKRNNHGIFAAIGLYFFGMSYPEFSESAYWKQLGENRILEELKLQYTERGVHREYAPMYHIALLDLYLHYCSSKLRQNEPLANGIRRALAGQLEFLRDMTDVDGYVIPIGDSADHHFMRMNADEPYCATATLHLGALMLSDRSLERTDPSAGWEAAWILGHRLYGELDAALKRLPVPQPEPELRCYSQEGFVRVENDSILFVCDFGTLGAEPRFGGHNHCDMSSLVLWCDGEPVLIDPGTFTYRRSLKRGGVRWRDFLRSSRAHNVVTVDDRSQAEPMNDFDYKQWPKARLLAAEGGEGCYLIVGEHDAYTDSVGRSIRVFIISGTSLTIIDWFPDAMGQHAYESNLICAGKGASLGGNALLYGPAAVSWASSPGLRNEMVEGSRTPPGGWRSRRYGSIGETSQFRQRQLQEGPALIATAIVCAEAVPAPMNISTAKLSAGVYAVDVDARGKTFSVILNGAAEREQTAWSHRGWSGNAFVAFFETTTCGRAIVLGGDRFKSPDTCGTMQRVESL